MSNIYDYPLGDISSSAKLMGNPTIRYPSPFFDLASTYLPRNVRELFQYCAYFFKTSLVINAACHAMAEYPVTEILYDTPDIKLREQYKSLESKIELESFQIAVGLDYSVYGNAFVSVGFPFQKHLICPKCQTSHYTKDKQVKFKFEKFRFELTPCRNCGYHGVAEVRDIYLPNIEGVRLIRWDPQRVFIDYNETTGKCTYYYSMSKKLRNLIEKGNPEVLSTIPQVFIEAAEKKKAIVFNENSVYHWRRPTIAEEDMGYGMPAIVSCLKDCYYIQILKKGQEQIVQEQIVPARIVFPRTENPAGDPLALANISEVMQKIKSEWAEWRRDNNRLMTMPFPIGVETVGGSGRALVLHQELNMLAEQLVIGIGIPPQLVFSGTQWSGTHPAMKLLQNKFLIYNNHRLKMVQWILDTIWRFLNWPRTTISFKKPKMVDDLQRISLLTSLEQQQKISMDTLLQELDLNYYTEYKKLREELDKTTERQRELQKANAAIQGEAQLIMANYQAQAQAAQMSAQMVGQIQANSIQQQYGQAGAVPTIPPSVSVVPQIPIQQNSNQLQGSQAGAGIPEQTSIYQDNAQGTPEQSPNQPLAAPQGGLGAKTPEGFDVQYVAKRVLAGLRKMNPDQAQQALNELHVKNPQVGSAVAQLLDQRSGSHVNPLNPSQAPMPEVKPPRRQM